MAKPPFLIPEPATSSVGNKALDFVFGPVEGPNLDNLFAPLQTGTGNSSLDDDIALRVAMLDDDVADFPDRLVQWKERMASMSQDDLNSYLQNAVQKARGRHMDAVLTNYSGLGQVDRGVASARKVEEYIKPGTPEYMDALTASMVLDWKNATDPFTKAQIRQELLKAQIGFVMKAMGVMNEDGSINWTEDGGIPLLGPGVKALLGTFIPLRNMLDFSNKGEGRNPVSGWNAFKDKIFDFNKDPNRPLDQQLQDFRGIMAQLLAETDNPFLFSERAEAFINPYQRSATKWGLIFDGVDLATIAWTPAKAAARAASYIAHSRKPIKVLRDIGKTEKAAELAAAAARDPKVAAAAKIDPVDAVLSASPFDGEQFDPKLTAGIAAETQKALVDGMLRVQAQVKEYLANLVSRNEWTEAERAAKESKFLAWAKKNRFVQKVEISARDTTGFTGEVTILRPKADRTQIRSPASRAILGMREADKEINKLIDAMDQLKVQRAAVSGEIEDAGGDVPQALYDRLDELDAQINRPARLKAEREAVQADIRDQERLAADSGGDVSQSLYDRLAELDAELAAYPSMEELLAKRQHFNALYQNELRLLRQERDTLAADIKDYLRLGDEAGVSVPQDKIDRLDVIDRLLKDPEEFLRLDPWEDDLQPVVEKINIKYTIDDWGNLDAEEWTGGLAEGASRYINSPELTVGRMLKGVVDEARARDLSAATLAEALREGLREAYRGVGPIGRRNVDAILMQGDTDMVDAYSVADLAQGIVTKKGLIRLKTVGEVRAYYGMRQIYRELHAIEGGRIKRDLELNGYRSVRFPDGEIGYAHAIRGSTDYAGTTYYDLAKGSIVTTSRRELQQKFNEGYRIYALKIYRKEQDATVSHILAKQSDLGDIPDNPLGYRKGYVPKVIDNVRFIGEIEEDIVVNGIKSSNRKVVQFFDNFTDMEIWKAGVRKKGQIPIATPADQYLKVGTNRTDLEARIFGGLYDSRRTDEVIGWNGSGTEGERVGAYEALEAYANHVASAVPTHIFKQKIATKFLNTIKAWEKRNLPEGAHVLSDPHDWSSEITNAVTGRQRAYFKAFQDWVMDQMRIPSTESRLWNNTTSRIAEWLAPTSRVTVGDNVRDLISRGTLSLGQRDVTGVMRSMAFHATLGWFNPVQLFVQAMGAANLAAAHPFQFMKLFGEYAVLRATLLSKNTSALNKTLEAAKAAGYGIKRQETLTKLIAFRKTGLWQQTKSTADAAALMTGGDGLAMSSFKMVADKGLVFYREGERLNRAVSWLWAADEFYKGRKLPSVIPDADIDAITKLSQKFSMNLDRSNRAMWQKGFASIPTQFMQVTAKFMEKMWYNVNRTETGWTAFEKLKISTNYAMMFGAAGVPFGTWGLSNLSDWATSKEPGGLGIESADMIRQLQDGFVGFFFNYALDADVEIASRVSLVDGFTQLIGDILDNQADIPAAALGVFGELPNRAVRIIGRLAWMASPTSWDEINENTVLEVMTETGMMISTFRQARKAGLMRKTQALWTSSAVDFDGEKVRDLSSKEARRLAFAQAIGFAPAGLEDYYQIRMYNRLTEKDLRDTVDALSILSQRIVNSDYYKGSAGEQRARTQIALITSDLSEMERRKVMKMLRNRMNENGGAMAKEIIKAAENYSMSQELTQGPPWNSSSVGVTNRLGRD